MKVLVVAAGYKPSTIYGGPTYSISALCEALVEQDCAVTVLTTNANGKNDLEFKNETIDTIEGVEVKYCRRATGDPVSFSPAHTWALLKYLSHYDLVHINGWWNWVAIMSVLICKLFRKPYVLSPRGSLSRYTFNVKHSKKSKKILHSLFLRHLLKNSFFHVTSDVELLHCREAVSQFRYSSIPNLIDIPPLFHFSRENNKPFTMVFLGRIHPVKNIELLLSALKQLDFPFRMHFIGEGEQEYVLKLKTMSRDDKRIQWHGSYEGEEKYRMLAQADLFVLLSHTENFGNVVIEALSQGTAVLVSRNVGASELVEEHQLGWVIEPELKVCVDTLNKIYSERQVLSDIRRRAPLIVQQILSPKSLSKRYIDECYRAVYS